MGTDSTLQAVVYVAGVWGGMIVPAIFAVYYTCVARWWKNPTGRTIIALDLCILALRAVRIDEAFTKHSPILAPGDWIVALAMICIPLAILYRMYAFERKRRLLKRQAAVSAATLRLIQTGLVP